MDLKIIAIGKIKDRSLLEKCDEYAAKIRFDAKLEMVEIKDGDKESEGAKILDHLKKEKAHVVALDEKGRACTSQEFARRLGAQIRKIVFIIGGPTGLSEAVKAAADEKMALSSMTFTHEMARMVLVEQIYRGISILRGRKYHRE
jgi:23S rRNA (pseudouridine1915-N3)-methyltransferase